MTDWICYVKLQTLLWQQDNENTESEFESGPASYASEVT